MLQASPHVIHFNRILDFGEGHALLAEAEEAIYNFKYAKTDPDGKFRAKAQACFKECDRRGQRQIYIRAFEHARDRWNEEHPEE
jgi:hypothetical protein